MPLESALYLIYSAVSITLSSVIAFLFCDRRNATGAKTMSFMMFCAAQWALSDLLSDLSTQLQEKILWDRIGYLGVVAIPVAWFIFSLQYTKRDKVLTTGNMVLLSAVPALTMLNVFTNDYHHLFQIHTNFAMIGTITTLDMEYGPLFWVHAAYSYILIIAGTFLIALKLVRVPKIYRSQSIIMFFACLIPFIGNIAFTFGINPIYPADPTVFMFIITGILFFLGMFKYKLFNLVPAARGAVIESMDEIVIVLDKQNRIIDINKQAKNMLGKGEEDLVGQSIFSLLKNNSELFLKYENILKVSEKIIMGEGSGKKCFDFRIAPLYEHNGKITGRFITMRDITEFEETMVRLEESRKAAENANKAKSQFLATMSHEIRTPLNGIIGMSELLTHTIFSEEEKGYILSIQNSADSLLEIINDILDFSKIEAGKMELEKTVFNIRILIDNIIKTFLYKAEEKNILLSCNIDDGIPKNLIGDQVRLRQVLINLVGNALKFTDTGSVKLLVEKMKDQENHVLLKFSVSDTGIGISQDKIGRLFNSFQQLDNSTTRKYGGTGLGLAIVKNLVSMMGGSIDVKSELGKGSTFSLVLTFNIADASAPDEYASAPEIDFSGRQIRVLLAEDNKTNQIFMTKLLERKKIKVDIAGTGKEVLEKSSQGSYDLILMDIQMPEMDGYEATQSIRRNEENTGKRIPIIALTANATEDDREECIKAGMDDYISKPVKSEKLFTYIKKYVS